MHNSPPAIKYTLLTALVSLPVCLACLSSCISREYAVVQNYEETEYRTEYHTEPYSDNSSTIRLDTTEYALEPYYYWTSQDLAFKDNSRMWYYGYDLPEFPEGNGARLKIYIWPQLQYEKMFLSVFDMTRAGHIDYPDPVVTIASLEKGLIEWSWITGSATNTWLDGANERMSHAKFLGGRSNVWSKPGDMQLIELNAGPARSIAIIVSGPQDKWNGRITLGVVPKYNIAESRQAAGENKTAREVPYQVKKQRVVYEFRQVPFWEAILTR